MELRVVVGASNQLECLVKSRRMLGRAVQRPYAANEGGHFPFCLTGGWRQKCLIALVERASPDNVCHSQHRDLGREKESLLAYSVNVFTFYLFQKSLRNEKAYRFQRV